MRGKLDGKTPLAQDQRRWTVNVMAARGLKSGVAQERIYASAVATAARIDETAFPTGPGQGSAAAQAQVPAPQINADKAFARFLTALQAVEAMAPPRTGKPIEELRRACAAAEKTAAGNPAKLAALAAAREQLRPYDLRDTVLGMKGPPWKPQDAAVAATAKVELDLLSLPMPPPPGKRSIQQLDAGAQGVNQAFWVNRSGGGGGEQNSYLCKPVVSASPVDGIPAGGEVAREAMAAHAAGAIGRMTGLSFNMPETHAIELDASFLPNGIPIPPSGKVTCSVQEARPSDGPLSRKPRTELATIPTQQCQNLGILDAITLNTDRHSGNMLVDNNQLVPIDHGATFMDPTIDRGRGLERIGAALGSPHNALLALPGSHEPMTPETLKALRNLNPGKLAKEFSQRREGIQTDTDELAPQTDDDPDLQEDLTATGMSDPARISDASIELSRRSAMFTKISAEFAGLSVASVQVALAKATRELFAPDLSDRDVEAVSRRFLGQALADQDVTKLACLLGPAERAQILDTLAAGGWPAVKAGAPGIGVQTDPALMLKLAAYGVLWNNFPVPPTPTGNHTPSADELREMKKAYPDLTGHLAAGRTNAEDEFEAWTRIKPRVAEINQLAGLGLMPLTGQRQPTTILQALGRLQAALAAIATAEAAAGGNAAAAIRTPVVQIKGAVAQSMVNMIVGPSRAQAQANLTAVLAQPGGDPIASVSAVSDQIFEFARANLRREAAEALAGGHLDAAGADTIKDAIGSGKVDAANQRIAALNGYNRPNWA